MSLLDRFLDKQPSLLQISDWIANMNDAFIELGQEALESDKSSSNMLRCFTLINTTQTAYNVIHAVPKTASSINMLYSELRAYFDCLWQLFLLHKYDTDEDQDKISKIAGSVSFSVENTYNSLFESNPRIANMLSRTIGSEYLDTMMSAVVKYLHGKHNYTFNDTGNPYTDNVLVLTSIVNEIDQFSDTEIKKIEVVFGEATHKALSLQFITQFDFKNCFVLPSEFFE